MPILDKPNTYICWHCSLVDGEPVSFATSGDAEQHAVDNEGHIVVILFRIITNGS